MCVRLCVCVCKIVTKIGFPALQKEFRTCGGPQIFSGVIFLTTRESITNQLPFSGGWRRRRRSGCGLRQRRLRQSGCEG
jgi:hypothetical protein